jgi:L-ectoine synthase
MIIRDLENVKTVEWGSGLSRRFLLEADGMGYTLTDTTVRKGTKTLIEYANHLEACYCIEGRGKVIEMDGTEHEIFAGRMYALDHHDTHWLLGGEEEDLRLVCMFTPALVGDEAHRVSESGIHPSVYGGVVSES